MLGASLIIVGGNLLVVVARDSLVDTILAGGFDAQCEGNFAPGESDSGVGSVAIPENLFTRSESKSSNLLMIFGSRIK